MQSLLTRTAVSVMSVNRPRSREFGVRIGSFEPGTYNCITDVQGVHIGQVTLIEGQGALNPGHGPIRTGVTAVLPHKGNIFREKVKAASFVINGFVKSIGLVQIDELGTLETPILLTNTLNVGIVADALIEHMLEMNPDIGVTTGTINPVVGECNDGFLNDIRGRHVKPEHVRRALRTATSEHVEEGAVGAGTGMSAFELKGGIGSSSRILPSQHGGYVVGSLVLSNFGRLTDLIIDGAPVGRDLSVRMASGSSANGSIIILVATNAPVSSRQLKRVAKRATHGLARTGSVSTQGSGDVVIAFSTTSRVSHYREDIRAPVGSVLEEDLSWLFRAAAEATEEAIINSLFKAETMIGRDGNTRTALPLDQTKTILEKYGRIQ